MPRGVKGSGKPKVAKVTKPVEVKKTAQAASGLAAYAPIEDKKAPTRKPYPSHDERLVLADKQIARLTALKVSREALVEKTATVLEERQKALASCVEALEKAEAKKEKILKAKEKAASKPAKEKLTPEERKARMAAGKAAKKAEKEKVEALMAALKTSGKSVEDLLAELKGE